MDIVTSENYKEYLNLKGVSENWRERDFLRFVRIYLNEKFTDVLLVCGLRGTGKTVGILQALKGTDFVYLMPNFKGEVNAKEVLEVLQQNDHHVVVIDEYTWIKGRKEVHLEQRLHAMVCSGKRVILTGTESQSLEDLRYGDLIHRSYKIHTTYFSFPEYCRVYEKSQNRSNCLEYLKTGGVFEPYSLRDRQSMESYVSDSIVANLIAALQEFPAGVDVARIPDLVYTLLYHVICDLLRANKKIFSNDELKTSNINVQLAEKLGIDLTGNQISRHELNEVADLLVSIGVLEKVPNFINEYYDSIEDDIDRPREYKTYVTNPSLAYQFIKAIFPDYENDSSLLGKLYEANCMIDMIHNKPIDSRVFYMESHTADNYEIDILLVHGEDTLKKLIYLVECKLAYNVNFYNKDISLLNGKLDKRIEEMFPDSDIAGRFIVHPGDVGWGYHKSGLEYAIVNQDDYLYHYYKFEEMKPELERETTKKMTGF